MGCASSEMCLVETGHHAPLLMAHRTGSMGGIGSWERGNDAEHPFTICSRDLKLAGIFPSVFMIPFCVYYSLVVMVMVMVMVMFVFPVYTPFSTLAIIAVAVFLRWAAWDNKFKNKSQCG